MVRGASDGATVRRCGWHIAANLGTAVPSHLAPSHALSHLRTIAPSHSHR
jgi:hypothetical protein